MKQNCKNTPLKKRQENKVELALIKKKNTEKSNRIKLKFTVTKILLNISYLNIPNKQRLSNWKKQN